MSPGTSVRAERRRDAHRLCATLADMLAEALREGDDDAARRYREDLARVERVTREHTKSLVEIRADEESEGNG